MTRMAQALHVARKDVMQHRWQIGVYIALVCAATAAAGSIGPFTPRFSMMWTLLFMSAAVFLLATFIMSDSPARTDAFWVTRPLDPTAVLGAKMLLALLLVIGVPLLGHVIVHVRHGSAPEMMFADTLHSGLTLLRTLLFVALLAALTKDLRTFALALLALLILSNFVGAWLRLEVLGAVPRGTHFIAVAAAGVATLLLLAHQYRTRNVRRGALLTFALILLIFWIPPAEAFSADGEPDALIPEVVLSRLNTDPRGFVESNATVTIEVRGADPSHQYALHLSKGWFYSQQTEDVDDVGLNGTTLLLHDPVLLPGVDLSSAGRPPRPMMSSTLQIELTPAQKSHLRLGTGDVAIQGNLEILRPTIVGSMPLREGASSTSAGHRFSIADLQVSGGDVELRMDMTSMTDDLDVFVKSYGKQRFLLVNDAAASHIELERSSASGNGVPSLPMGVRVREMQLRSVSRRTNPQTRTAVTGEWLSVARLVIIDMQPVGGRRLTLNTADSN